MKVYNGKPLGEINDNIPPIDPQVEAWMTDEQLQYIQINMQEDQPEINRRSAVAAAALLLNCPVPGNVYESLGGDGKTHAAIDVARAYLSPRFFWREIVMNLQSLPSESNRRKLHFLQGTMPREQGNFKSPDWPPEGHGDQFNTLLGITLPASFAIPRIFREALVSNWSVSEKQDFYFGLMDYIVDVDILEGKDFIDFLIGVAAKAIELKLPSDSVFKIVVSWGYYIAENNLHQLFEQLLERLNNHREISEEFHRYLGGLRD